MSNSTYEDDDRLLDGDEKAFTNEDIDDDELLYSSDEENDWQTNQQGEVSNEVAEKPLDNDLQDMNDDLKEIKSYDNESSFKEETEESTFTMLESENNPIVSQEKAEEVQTLVSTENKNAQSGSKREETLPPKESEDEGDSDDDGSTRRGDRFHSERKQDTSSAINFRPEPASKRAIPDTLEISKEDQQRIENFSKSERDKKNMNNNKRKRGVQGGGRGKGNFQPYNRQQFNRQQQQMFGNNKMMNNIRMQQRPPVMFQPQQRPPWKNHNSGVGGSILGQPPAFMQQPPASVNQPRLPPQQQQQLNFQQISTINRPLEPAVLLTAPPFRFSPPPNQQQQQRQQSPVLQQHTSFASTIPVLSRTANFAQQPNLTTIKTISTPQPAGNPIPTLLTSAQQQQKTTSPQSLQPHNFPPANPYLSLSAQQGQQARIAPPASAATNQQLLVKSDTAAQLMAAAAAAATRHKKSAIESLMEVTVARKSRSPSPHRNRSSSSKRVVMRSSRRSSRSPPSSSSRKRVKYSSSSRRRSKSRSPPDEAKPKTAAAKTKILINPHFKGKVNLQNLTKQPAAQPSSTTTVATPPTTTATSQHAATNLLQAPITIPPPNLLTGAINIPPPNMTFPPNLINHPPPPLPSALLHPAPAAYQPLVKQPQVVVPQQQASNNNRQLVQQAPHNPILSTSVNVATNRRNNVKSSSPTQSISVKSRLGSKTTSNSSSSASGTRLRPPPTSAANNSKEEIKATVWGVVSDEDSIYRKKVEEQQLKRKLFLAEKAKKRMAGGREQGDEVKTVKFTNLASKTKAEVLKSLMSSVGGVESLQLFPQENSALGTFRDSKSVKAFTEKYNRYLLDLSYISVKPYRR